MLNKFVYFKEKYVIKGGVYIFVILYILWIVNIKKGRIK